MELGSAAGQHRAEDRLAGQPMPKAEVAILVDQHPCGHARVEIEHTGAINTDGDRELDLRADDRCHLDREGRGEFP